MKVNMPVICRASSSWEPDFVHQAHFTEGFARGSKTIPEVSAPRLCLLAVDCYLLWSRE